MNKFLLIAAAAAAYFLLSKKTTTYTKVNLPKQVVNQSAQKNNTRVEGIS